MGVTITVGELIEILELFDSDQPVYMSPCIPIQGADSIRKVRKSDDENQNIEEDSFVSIR